MKVALVINLTNSFGGAERRLVRVYSAICKEHKKIQCDIIAVGVSTEKAIMRLKQADCPITGLRILGLKKIPFVFYLMCSRKYQAMHYFGTGPMGFLIQSMCLLQGKKSIFTACNYLEAYALLPEYLMKRIKRQLRHADYVDLLYPAGADFVGQYTGGKLFITPGTFTNLEVFKPLEKEKNLVYAAARLDDNKDPMLLVEAAHMAQDHIRRNGYHVIILGRGKYEKDIELYIAQNGLSDIIQMVGYERTSRYLPSAEVFFSLQKYENYPSQSLAEAVACGCYSIITDVGDSRKCAKEEFAAFVEGNAGAVAQAIIRYVGMSAEEKREIVSSARAFALQNYTIEKSKDYYRMLIEKACM